MNNEAHDMRNYEGQTQFVSGRMSSELKRKSDIMHHKNLRHIVRATVIFVYYVHHLTKIN